MINVPMIESSCLTAVYAGTYTKSGGVAESAHSTGGLPEPPLGRESKESGVALRDRGSLPLEFCNKAILIKNLRS